MDVFAGNRVAVPVEKRLDKIEDNLAFLCTQLQNVMTFGARMHMNQSTAHPMAPNPRTLAEWTGGPVEQARLAGPPQAHRQDKNGQTMGDRYGRHIQHV